MAWQDTMVTMLRILLNDNEDGVQTFTDKRLEQVLVMSASLVQQEINLDNSYTIQFLCGSISPDPTDSATEDSTFVNLVVMKSACMIDVGSLRAAAFAAGIKAKCGPAVIETLKRMDGFKTLIEEGYCAMYAEMKNDYQFGNTSHLKAILSPFTSPDFDPEDYASINKRVR